MSTIAVTSPAATWSEDIPYSIRDGNASLPPSERFLQGRGAHSVRDITRIPSRWAAETAAHGGVPDSFAATGTFA